MPFRNINDPRDPWAFRETWTGEARASYEELWIVVPLAVGLLLVAFMLLLPLLVHKWCRAACPCPAFWRLFDNFLRVLHEIGKKKVLQEESANSFDNPAFDPPPASAHDPRAAEAGRARNVLPIHLRSSVRYVKNPKMRGRIARSRSCPPARLPPAVPKIKI